MPLTVGLMQPSRLLDYNKKKKFCFLFKAHNINTNFFELTQDILDYLWTMSRIESLDYR
jgi:hypothetical protein